MSRSGLFRAAAMLAAGAAPLLAGAANAAPSLPAVDGGVPNIGAGELVTDAAQHANPLEAGKTVKLPVATPQVPQLPVDAPALPGAQERTIAAPLAPELGTLPAVPNPDALLGGTHVGDLKAPKVSDLPTNGVISGTLPTING